MADFLMPALGADMETGRLVQWLVKPGDRVRRGDIVAVVETHKGAIDVEIFLDGVIRDLAPLGQDMKVGALLARVGPADEAASPAVSVLPSDAVMPVPQPAPAAAIAVKTGAVSPQGAADAIAVAAPVPGRRPLASPAARQRARELGLSREQLAAIAGSGVGGAVSLADVESVESGLAGRVAVPIPLPLVQPVPGSAPAAAGAAVRRGFDPQQMRQAIGAAMGRSKREIPHYYLSSPIDFHAAQSWLLDYNRDREPEQRLLPAVLLLKAAALALRELPGFNGFCQDGAFRPGDGIHVGWAVALRGGGLVAPAVHDADRMTLPELMSALRDLVQRARAGGLRSSELTDPTVTVTSLGERGAETVWGVIYPPQVAIIGFGRITERPWVVDGQVVPRPLIQVSLAADHRISDGHQGGQLLAAIDRALQVPEDL